MPLSDTACKNAKPKDKPYKLADEKGMFLLINPNGYFKVCIRFSVATSGCSRGKAQEALRELESHGCLHWDIDFSFLIPVIRVILETTLGNIRANLTTLPMLY